MATRDRTALFLRYREEAGALHGDTPGALRSRSGGRLGVDEAASSLPGPVKRARTAAQVPGWLHVYNDLVGDIAEVDKALGELSSLYAKHLLPSFGAADTAELEGAIRLRAGELTELLREAEGKVRRIGAGSGAGEPEEALVKRNVQKRFASQIQERSLDFRKKQKEYLSELRGQQEALGEDGSGGPLVDLEGQGGLGGLGGLGGAGGLDGAGGMGCAGSAVMGGELVRGEDRSAMAEERAREITKIAANINDLATIVKDLATLVVDQGTILDRVDYNVEAVRETTKDAVRELRIADRYQKKRHAFWCIVFLAIGCGIMFCLLMRKWFS